MYFRYPLYTGRFCTCVITQWYWIIKMLSKCNEVVSGQALVLQFYTAFIQATACILPWLQVCCATHQLWRTLKWCCNQVCKIKLLLDPNSETHMYVSEPERLAKLSLDTISPPHDFTIGSTVEVIGMPKTTTYGIVRWFGVYNKEEFVGLEMVRCFILYKVIFLDPTRPIVRSSGRAIAIPCFLFQNLLCAPP